MRLPDDGLSACVVYAARGKVALALHRDPLAPELLALRQRLERKGYTVVLSLPAAPLRSWAHPDTVPAALYLAGQLLKQREGR